MTQAEAIHPDTDRLAAYALGQLDGPEMNVIELHLSACDSCCRVIEDQPGDSLVRKLRERGVATASTEAPGDSATELRSGFEVPSSFVLGPAANTARGAEGTVPGLPPEPAEVPGLPSELIDHPRYRVVADVGSGGMGVVYRALHRLMDRPVALKVIRADLLGSAALVERFRREVKAAARLAAHPNIVVAYDAEQAGATHMLVMEFVEGTDLARLVNRRGPLPVSEACEYARQAALGLEHAFADGMVHRDIKPQNLMRTTRGQIKILDFGLARFASEVTSRGGMTAEGMFLGSADYIAPEQIDDPHAADIRADIYSLGCTLYFMLAGHPPFPEPSLIQKLLAHGDRVPRPLAEVRSGVPPELVQVIERMMAKDPAQRFRAPADVARALAAFALDQTGRTAALDWDAPASDETLTLPAGSSSFATPTGVPQKMKPAAGPHLRRPRRWLPIAAALLLLPICAAALAVGIYRIKTNTGELIIVTDDPNIEVIVTQGGNLVTIVDPRSKNKIELKAGNYELQLGGGGEGLRLSADTFTLKRGDMPVVSVRREPMQPPRMPALPPEPRTVMGELLLPRIPPPHSRPPESTDASIPNVIERRSSQPSMPDHLSGTPPEQVGEIARFQSDRGVNDGAPGIAMAFLLADGKHVLYTASVSESDVALRLGDIADPKNPRELVGHGAGQISLAVSRDGRHALSASEDTTLRLWDLETVTSRRVRREAIGLGAVAFSPDQRRAAYVCGATIRVCDLKTGDELMSFEAQKEGTSRVAFSATGDRILAYGGDVRVWNVETRKEVRRIGEGYGCWGLAVFPDNRRVLTTGGWYSQIPIVVWDMESGKQIQRIPLFNATPVAVSGDGRRALVGAGMTVWLWDLETGEEIERFEGHRGEVHHVAFSPDGRRGVSASGDKSVRVWALPASRQPGERPAVTETSQFLDDTTDFPQLAVVSPDGKRILSTATKTDMCLWDGDTRRPAGANVQAPPPAPSSMHLWNRETGRLISRFAEGQRATMAVAFSPDGRTALSGGLDAVLRLWDVETGQVVREFRGHTEQIFSVAFSPDGQLAYSTSGGVYKDGRWQDGPDSAVRVWDVATGREVRKLEGHKGIVWGVAVSPNGRSVLTCGRDQNVILWGAATGAEIRRLRGHTASVGCVAFLPDGRHALSSALDRTIRLWDLDSGQETYTFRGNTDGLAWVAVSPDGKRMLSSDFTGYELRLWDLESRGLVRLINRGNTNPTRGSFTPDGRHAVWAGLDGAVRMYELPPY